MIILIKFLKFYYFDKNCQKIEKKFYQHLSDLIVENIWAIEASPKQLQKQCIIEDIHVFEELYQQKRDFILSMML